MNQRLEECSICNCKYDKPKRKKYCTECQILKTQEDKIKWYKRNYVKKEKVKTVKIKEKKLTKGDWIVELLKRQNATKETLCHYVKADWHTVRQLITNMRFKGWNISLNGSNEYELNEIKCPDCNKSFQNSLSVKNHWGHIHK